MTSVSDRPARGDRALAAIERVGNRLPEPFSLFAGLYLLVAVASTVLALAGVTVQLPGAEEPTAVRGFFTGEGVAWFTTTLVENFVGFPPLGTVVVILLAVGLAERTGLLAAVVRLLFGRAPRWLLPYAVGLVGVTGSVMADSAMLVIPPLAAMVFAAAGRHPVAGLLGGYAAASAGYSTSLVVTSLDALFAGITSAVAQSLPDPGVPVTPLSNYFFNIAASLLLAVVCGLVITRVLEPRLERLDVPREQAEQDEAGEGSGGPGSTGPADDDALATPQQVQLGPEEKRGLVVAGAWALVLSVGMAVLALVPGSPLRGPGGSFLPESPLLDATVFIVVLLLAVPGVAYGRVVGRVRGTADLTRIMAAAVTSMAPFIVLAFVLGQFIALFTWTGLGTVIADRGAAALQSIGLTGFSAIVGFVVLASVLNFLITSGSSMWTLMAAVFVPLFGVLGYEPAFVQAAFRVGDSATQVLTPLSPYMIIVLAQLRQWEPAAGMGTLIARMLPFSVAFWLAWLGLLALFYATGAPLGPGQDYRL